MVSAASVAAFGAGPSVQQSYKTVSEIFLPNGANPGPWNARPARAAWHHQHRRLEEHPVASRLRTRLRWLIDQKGNLTHTTSPPTRRPTTSNGFYNATPWPGAQNTITALLPSHHVAAWRVLTSQDK